MEAACSCSDVGEPRGTLRSPAGARAHHICATIQQGDQRGVTSRVVKMPFSVHGILCTLVLLVLWRREELAEACSCAPVHPQQAFCNADVGESLLLLLMMMHIWREPAAPPRPRREAGGAGCSSRPGADTHLSALFVEPR